MRIFVLLLPLLFSACGFALRGADVLPPDLDKLHINANGTLRNEVEEFLVGSNTEIVNRRADADVILSLSNPSYDRRVLSVNPNTGREREFELAYSFDIVATTQSGRVLLKPQKISLRRDYVFDRSALIGSSAEESILREEMRRDLIQQALYRLRAATTQ